MSMKCELTGKSFQTGNNVSHAKNRTKRRFLPNLQKITFISEKLGQKIQLKVAASTIRTVEKKGGLDDFLVSTPNSKLPEKAKKLKQIADKFGIEFFCSAFYPEAIQFLEKLKVKRYKIGSRTCLQKDPFSSETLHAKSNTRKPVIISMGMGGNKKNIEKIFSKNIKTFCYCISEYPTKINQINWKDAVKYDGFSDHTLGITAPIIFAILKKQQNSKNIIIEKHVKLSNSKGPDASSSIDTTELSQLVLSIRQLEKLKI